MTVEFVVTGASTSVAVPTALWGYLSDRDCPFYTLFRGVKPPKERGANPQAAGA